MLSHRSCYKVFVIDISLYLLYNNNLFLWKLIRRIFRYRLKRRTMFFKMYCLLFRSGRVYKTMYMTANRVLFRSWWLHPMRRGILLKKTIGQIFIVVFCCFNGRNSQRYVIRTGTLKAKWRVKTFLSPKIGI